MEKRYCGYGGKCKTLTEVDPSLDNEILGAYVIKWCDYHEKMYHKQSEAMTKLLPLYNKKKLKNKFGRLIKFSHHSDLSNYLYENDKKTLRKITKEVELKCK
jgi:hypothetical protein